VWKLFVQKLRDLRVDRGSARTAAHPGPHREGEELKPMMHDSEKSDSVIVAKKPANKAEPSAAELAEPRTENARRAPKKILNAHPPDQFRIVWPTSWIPRLRAPVATKASPMPAHQRLGPNDHDGPEDGRKPSI
jgi:hypothetical protein